VVPSSELLLPAARRSAQFHVELDAGSVDAGAVFVVVVSALDQNGNVLTLQTDENGQSLQAVVDSEELRVEVLDVESPEVKKKATARSIAESKVQLAVAGRDPSSVIEKITRDDESCIASVYSVPRDVARIPFSPLLLEAELQSIGSLNVGLRFQAVYGQADPAQLDSIDKAQQENDLLLQRIAYQETLINNRYNPIIDRLQKIQELNKSIGVMKTEIENKNNKLIENQ
jgi:predicted metallopeptidase